MFWCFFIYLFTKTYGWAVNHFPDIKKMVGVIISCLFSSFLGSFSASLFSPQAIVFLAVGTRVRFLCFAVRSVAPHAQRQSVFWCFFIYLFTKTYGWAVNHFPDIKKMVGVIISCLFSSFLGSFSASLFSPQAIVFLAVGTRVRFLCFAVRSVAPHAQRQSVFVPMIPAPARFAT